ncbi:MAG TPA: glycosyltransferase family 9 protein [Ktedonobacterales bacterium]|nr:glycosyltransferase family 9 protein [Ktedonobacterales bacterium]
MGSEPWVLIRPGALGDTLLLLPALALLRRARPSAHITLVARRDVLRLACASGLADAGADYAAPEWSALFAETPLARGGAVARMLEGAHVSAWLADAEGLVARNLAAFGAAPVVVAPGRPDPAGPHAALQLARGLAPFGIPLPASGEGLAALLPPLAIPDEDERTAEALWRALGISNEAAHRRVIALHPGSGGAAKRWPAERFGALAHELAAGGWSPLLVEGPADQAAVAEALAVAGDEMPVARGLSVGALAALLRRCAASVGNDSGVSHLAGLLGMPALALFGPTDPAVWAPLGRRVRVLRTPDGRLDALTVAAVQDALAELLD